MPFDYITELLENKDTKIVLLVMDGLGGLPIEAGGKTELVQLSVQKVCHRGIVVARHDANGKDYHVKFSFHGLAAVSAHIPGSYTAIVCLKHVHRDGAHKG